MKKILLIGMTLWIILAACSNSSSHDQRIQVAFHDVPYPTETYLRIGYTLKTWEYEKEGLELQQIKVLDGDDGEALFTIDRSDLPVIHKDPIAASPYFVWDKLEHYYLSIQLPIPLERTPPRNVFHRFILKKTSDSSELTVEGGAFSPRTNESPVVIASPLKGENLYFMNQSTMKYHFYVALFTEGSVYTPERYAIDTIEYDRDLISSVNESGLPEDNTSYLNYGRTLYAVADGTVVHLVDGRPENHGNREDVVFHSADEYGGNYLVLDIGNGRYAFYCHCIPGSFRVAVGDRVREGDQLARLGNSGSSTYPHLHFHIADRPEFLKSYGIPFVLRGYSKTGTLINPGPGTPVPNRYYTNAMMENTTVFKVE